MPAALNETHFPTIVANSQWFEGLPPESLQRLVESAKVRRFQKDSYVFSSGDRGTDIYCLLSGRVRLKLSSPLGQEFAIVDKFPEQWFGDFAIAVDEPRILDALTLEKAEIAAVPGAVVREIASKHPHVYENLFKSQVEAFKGLFTLLNGLAFHPLRSRLARWFLHLIEDHGEETDSGIAINVKLSQTDFALLSLGSRQRINMILSDWREKGIVEKKASRYVVRNLDALKEEYELSD